MNEILESESISISKRIVLGRNHQSLSFSGSFVDHFAYIYQVLRLFEDPGDLIIVSSARIDHDMFVSVEEHESKWIKELVHLVEVWYFCDVHHVEYDEIA